MKPTESAVNDTLRVLRKLADARVTKELENGRIAAKITLPPGEKSFGRYVGEKCGLSSGTVNARVGWLVKAGLVNPGVVGKGNGDRWVCLEGLFSYADLPGC